MSHVVGMSLEHGPSGRRDKIAEQGQGRLGIRVGSTPINSSPTLLVCPDP